MPTRCRAISSRPGPARRCPVWDWLAKAYEKFDPETGQRFTWCERESLEELEQPSRSAEIIAKHQAALARTRKRQANRPLVDVLAEVYDDEDNDQPCFFCQH